MKAKIFFVLCFVFALGLMVVKVQAHHWRWDDHGSEYYRYGECIPNEKCGTTEGTKTKEKVQDQRCEWKDTSQPNECTDGQNRTIVKQTYSPVKCEVKLVECEPEVTPTPTPEVTPEPTPAPCTSNCGSPPTFAGSSTEPPKCGESDPEPVVNPHVYRSNGDAIVKWWPVSGNQVHIYYKQVNSPDWQYSVTTANTGYYEIHGLDSMDISFAVQAVNGCSGGTSILSKIIVDGASNGWTLFR